MSPRMIGLRTRALSIGTVALLAVISAVGVARSAPGTVLSKQKISETVGGFTGNELDLADEFGGALCTLGDLDGAGPSVVAVAVGTYGDDDGGTDRGAVYILFLSSSGLALSHQKISDLEGGFTAPLVDADEFGTSVAHLGDLDGAGPSVAALAVGASFDDDGGANDDRGAVYILFLDSAGMVLSHQKISATQGNFAGKLDPLDEFGTSVASLGDLDGEGPGVAALAVGTGGDDDGGENHGAIYILFLTETGTVLSHQKISDTEGGFSGILEFEDEFGVCAPLGDLDGAGSSVLALAVGAAGDDDGGVDCGAVYILFLSSSGSVLSDTKISNFSPGFGAPLQNEDDFGSVVVWLGDLDGPAPSVATLAVGSARDDDGGGVASNRGAVHVLFLNSSGALVSDTTISATTGNFGSGLDSGDQFGASIGALGDIDGPGGASQTLIAGAPFDDDGGTNQGAFYVMFLDGVACPTLLLAPASLPNASVGTPYSETITASGGTSPYGFVVTVGAEPPGLTLGSDGTLSGTPTTAGIFTFTVQATDAAGCSGSREYTLAVCGTVTLAPASLPNATEGTSYSETITASGGTSPYSFTVTVGAEPPGLTLGSDGTLSGTPTTAGDYDLTVEATDASGCSGILDYSITVCSVITVSPSTLPNGTVGTAYSQIITASGGTEPYDFSITTGKLPPGLYLWPGGEVFGTPKSQGSYTFTISATDKSGECSGGQAYTMEIIDPTAVDAIRAVGRTGLRGVLPNPVGRAGQLVYEIAHGGPVKLMILDVAGKQVKVFDQGERSPGLYRIAWDGRDDRGRALNGGVYFVQMVADGRSQGVLRIVVVK